jgi:hypothetical protein
MPASPYLVFGVFSSSMMASAIPYFCFIRSNWFITLLPLTYYWSYLFGVFYWLSCISPPSPPSFDTCIVNLASLANRLNEWLVVLVGCTNNLSMLFFLITDLFSIKGLELLLVRSADYREWLVCCYFFKILVTGLIIFSSFYSYSAALLLDFFDYTFCSFSYTSSWNSYRCY